VLALCCRPICRVRDFLVHQFLVDRGVNEAMLETRFFGEVENFLIVRNSRTAADRDRNRRVTLLLQRR
jgi:outer membrane protein OmpA-like peptidoglycan-associated protein